MSPLDRPVPPAGEEIHLPGGSAQPVLLAISIMIALLGVTLGPIIWIPGAILTVAIIVAWIRDARRELEDLPLEHHVATHDTVPRPQDRPRSS
jgi:hypothetical protein